MRKVFKRALMMVVGFAPLALSAQAPQPLPLDPSVRHGKLENGLTYYVQNNKNGDDRAEFYIVQRVGSILESEEQRGLAHFLEHMAFNGTKNFPDKTMLTYLESNGVKFGTNVNAYTSIDETVYNLSKVPTTNANLVDSCLLILHDWSGFISLEEEEIDNERGVIHEEWRTRQNAYLRMYENAILPALYPNNRYGERMPIGLMDVVNNCSYDVLRDYYHTWYRPDLQAIVVVGDIDADQIEARIKELWKDIPAPVNPVERTYYQIENNVEPLVAIASDKELTRNMLSVMYKQDVPPTEFRLSHMGLMVAYVNQMITTMTNMRYSEVAQKSDAPFLQASVEYGDFILSQTKHALNFTVVYRDGEWKEGLDAMMAVANSVREHGFNESEFERVKAQFTSFYENAYNERDKQSNEALVNQYVDHFLHALPAMGIEAEYAFFQNFLNMLTVEQVNQIAKSYFTEENVAMMMMAIEKEGADIPTETELLAAYKKAEAAEAVAYVDEMSNKPLITEIPQAGTIKKVKDGAFGSTEWILSNGAKVVIKHTDFKKDEIQLIAVSPGGKSYISNDDLLSKKAMNELIAVGGVGEFSAIDLKKVLSGKRVNVSKSVGNVVESLTGATSPKDLETMLQLTYLNFVAPRTDEDAFKAWQSRTSSMLANYESNPQVVFGDSLTAIMYDHNPTKKRLTLEDISAIDYNRINELANERFTNAKDWTFIFVGNVDEQTLRPLVETYIASLPTGGKTEKLVYDMPKVEKGHIDRRFDLPMATPKTTVYNILSGKMKGNLSNSLTIDILSQVMSMVYLESIREKEGGTYGVSVQAQIESNPKDQFMFLYGFDTGEDKRERLEEIAYRELVNVAAEGPKKEHFDKVKEYLVKANAERVKQNSYWQGALLEEYMFGEDNVSDYLKTLNSIEMKDIQKMAKKIISSGNRMQIISTGVELN